MKKLILNIILFLALFLLIVQKLDDLNITDILNISQNAYDFIKDAICITITALISYFTMLEQFKMEQKETYRPWLTLKSLKEISKNDINNDSYFCYETISSVKSDNTKNVWLELKFKNIGNGLAQNIKFKGVEIKNNKELVNPFVIRMQDVDSNQTQKILSAIEIPKDDEKTLYLDLTYDYKQSYEPNIENKISLKLIYEDINNNPYYLGIGIKIKKIDSNNENVYLNYYSYPEDNKKYTFEDFKFNGKVLINKIRKVLKKIKCSLKKWWIKINNKKKKQ